MKKGFVRSRYYAKPNMFEHSRMCEWCFANIGEPDNLFFNPNGKWTVNVKKGIFYFNEKKDRDMFSKVWYDK